MNTQIAIVATHPGALPEICADSGYDFQVFQNLEDFIDESPWSYRPIILILDSRSNGERAVKFAAELAARLKPSYPILLLVRNTDRNIDLSELDAILLAGDSAQITESLKKAESKGSQFTLKDLGELLLLNHHQLGLER